MHFKLEKYRATNPLSKLVKLTGDDRHRGFIKQLSSSCQKGDSVVYVLWADNEICGFLGISTSKIDSIPYVKY